MVQFGSFWNDVLCLKTLIGCQTTEIEGQTFCFEKETLKHAEKGSQKHSQQIWQIQWKMSMQIIKNHGFLMDSLKHGREREKVLVERFLFLWTIIQQIRLDHWYKGGEKRGRDLAAESSCAKTYYINQKNNFVFWFVLHYDVNSSIAVRLFATQIKGASRGNIQSFSSSSWYYEDFDSFPY